MVLLRHYTSSDLGVKTLFIEPGSPWENGYNESFNGTLRNELLKREIFYAIPSYGLSGLIAFGTIVSPQSSELVHPSTPDLMSYCRPKWISDYHFANALRFRLFDERPPLVAAMSLLLWGGLDAEGEPFLNPAFVVDAPPALPIPPVSTGSPDVPPAATSSSPSASPCPRWSTATGARPSPSSSRLSPAGPATWRPSRSQGPVGRLRWTATRTCP